MKVWTYVEAPTELVIGLAFILAIAFVPSARSALVRLCERLRR